MRALTTLLFLAATVIACGGGEPAEPADTTATATVAAATPDLDGVGDVEATALAFLDSSLGTTLAISVAENDAGLQWIDVALDEAGDIKLLTAQTEDGLLAISLEGDAFTITAPEHDLVVRGIVGASEVTVIRGGEATALPVDATASRDGHTGGWWPTSYDPPATIDPSVRRQEANPLEYVINRPTRITSEVVVDVATETADGFLDPIADAIGFGLTAGCAADTSGLGSLYYSCQPISDSQVTVTTQVELPTPENWQGRNQVFASRERCEAWVSYINKHRSAWSFVGLAVAPALGLADPWAAISTKVTAGAMGWVLNRSASVPCGTITVADEYVNEQIAAHRGLTIRLDVSAVAYEWSFSTDSGDVRPFAPVNKADGPLVLVATPIDGATPEATGPTSNGDFDGLYRGSAGLYEYEEGDGTIVERDGLELVVSNGRVVDLRGGTDVKDTPTETGGGRVLCRSDVSLDLQLMEPVDLVDGAAEAAIEWRVEQSMGRPTAAANEGCDPDLAGNQTFPPLQARISIEGEIAFVEVFFNGQSLAPPFVLVRQ
ncbi:MAG: hypothetical protein H6675_09425 [Dehalococcoidia bacterium]|nr:hypothetical protein [Dehalococcoidia bacterium]